MLVKTKNGYISYIALTNIHRNDRSCVYSHAHSYKVPYIKKMLQVSHFAKPQLTYCFRTDKFIEFWNKFKEDKYHLVVNDIWQPRVQLVEQCIHNTLREDEEELVKLNESN